MAVGDDNSDNCRVRELKSKLKQEQMIYDTILRIKEQYEGPEAIRKTEEKLEESRKRIQYLQFEVDRIMETAGIGSRKTKDPETYETILKSIREIQGPLDYWRPTGWLTSDALTFKIRELTDKHSSIVVIPLFAIL